MRERVAARARRSHLAVWPLARRRSVSQHPVRQYPVRQHWARRPLAACCAVAALALVVAACGSDSPAAVGRTPVSGGKVIWAMLPEQDPNYIFPFTEAGSFSTTNMNYFQYLMYRPLYWFGNGEQPTLNESNSLAERPVYHGQDVTITLKGNYRWSDGTPVTAQDVMFWMNMLMAEKNPTLANGQGGWGGYVPGAFPDNVTDVRAVGTDEITMVIKGAYSQQWFTDNELSQITPLPPAWDKTGAATQSDCATDVADCAAVYKFLMAQNADTKTYATSSIWGVVDGPWKLVKYTLGGDVLFRWNKAYAGPVPSHHITTFEEVPYTTDQAEYDALQSPQAAQRPEVGYLPTVDAPVRAPGEEVGANPLSPGYRLQPQEAWGMDYIPYDFNNPAAGPIFDQLYFRKAFEYLVDQEGVINGPLHGYGTATTGPVGDSPVTSYLSPQAKLGDQYSLNTSQAESLLKEHGWNVAPGRRTTCVSPGSGAGDCGAGIAQGTSLTFSIDYVSGVSWVQSAVRELISNAAEVGITINPQEGSFNQVTSQLGECVGSTHSSSSCHWQLLDWGQGWTYSPDYLPTGEELFLAGSSGNFGGFNNAENDHLIKETLQTSNGAFTKAFYKWENYLAAELPVVMQPQTPSQLTETADNLSAPTEPPTLMLTPEDWYYMR
jgi:peptide/nickel transport system substrate-binding protein